MTTKKEIKKTSRTKKQYKKTPNLIKGTEKFPFPTSTKKPLPPKKGKKIGAISKKRKKRLSPAAKRYFKRRANKIRVSAKLLYKILRNLKYGAIKRGFKKRSRINTVYSQVKKHVTKRISSRLPTRLVISRTTSMWRTRLHLTRKFYRLNYPTIKFRLKGHKLFARYLGGKRLRKKRSLRRVRSKRLYKLWLLMHRLSTFSRLYSKKNKKRVKARLVFKKRSKKKLQLVWAIKSKLVSYMETRLEMHAWLGTFGDFEDYELVLESTEWPKKFVRDYTSSFLYNGRPIGSPFGVYLAFHGYINHYRKRRYRRFMKRFDVALREDLNDYNEEFEDGFDILNRINESTLETKVFRRGELWYHKNYLRQIKCYSRNGSTNKKIIRKRSKSTQIINNAPFTLFGRVFPLSSLDDRFVTESLYEQR